MAPSAGGAVGRRGLHCVLGAVIAVIVLGHRERRRGK